MEQQNASIGTIAIGNAVPQIGFYPVLLSGTLGSPANEPFPFESMGLLPAILPKIPYLRILSFSSLLAIFHLTLAIKFPPLQMMRISSVPPMTPHDRMSPELLTTTIVLSRRHWSSTMGISLGGPILMSDLMVLEPCFFMFLPTIIHFPTLLLWFRQSTFHLLSSSSSWFCSFFTTQLPPLTKIVLCYVPDISLFLLSKVQNHSTPEHCSHLWNEIRLTYLAFLGWLQSRTIYPIEEPSLMHN